jgi:MEKHLA domain
MIEPDETVPLPYREPQAARRIAAMAQSFARLLGRPLVAPGDDLIAALWHASPVIVAHGTEPDPLFFYGNRAALSCFEADLDSLLAMPSRLSAEAPLRAEREAMFERVRAHGFIDDYAGVRISTRGLRFRIARGVVWTVTDTAGTLLGQAATFTP